MYYKVENKKSKVYKALYALREKEIRINKENLKTIKEKTGLNFETYLGSNSQQSFRRVPQYEGFKFTEPDKVDSKTWKKDQDHKDIFVPNRRTKLGREMEEFLTNGLQSSWYEEVFDILKLEHPRRFRFPYVEIANEIILIYLDEKQEPGDENVIEITKKEFEKILPKN